MNEVLDKGGNKSLKFYQQYFNPKTFKTVRSQKSFNALSQSQHVYGKIKKAFWLSISCYSAPPYGCFCFDEILF